MNKISNRDGKTFIEIDGVQYQLQLHSSNFEWSKILVGDEWISFYELGEKLGLKDEKTPSNLRNVMSDLVSDFLYYDRQEDEDLSIDDIEELYKTGVWTMDDTVSFFKEALEYELRRMYED